MTNDFNISNFKVTISDTQLSDAQFILELENNSDYWIYSHTKEPFTLKDIELFIVKNIISDIKSGQKRFIIRVKNEAAGCIDLFDIDIKNKRAGIGILIHPNYQHKGIATKGLQLLIKKCKKEFKFHQIYCTILSDNNYSIRLFENQGFVKTGTRNDWTFYNKKFYDEIFYQLIL